MAYADNDHALALHSIADEVGWHCGEHPRDALQSSNFWKVGKPLAGMEKSVGETVSGCRIVGSYVVADARKITLRTERPNDPERFGHGDGGLRPSRASIPGARRRQLAFPPPRPNPGKNRLVADPTFGLVLGYGFCIRPLVGRDILVSRIRRSSQHDATLTRMKADCYTLGMRLA